MPKIPPIEDLEKEFDSYLDNPGVLFASCWNQPNTDFPCDEEAYLQRAEINSNCLGELLGDRFSE